MSVNVLPRAIFIKGELIQNLDLIRVLKKNSGENLDELLSFLKPYARNENLKTKQIVYIGEGDAQEFIIILIDDLRKYMPLSIEGHAGNIIEFLSPPKGIADAPSSFFMG